MIIRHSFSTLTLSSHRKIERIPFTTLAQAASLDSTTIRPIFSASSGDPAVTNTTTSPPFTSTIPLGLSNLRANQGLALSLCSYKSMTYELFCSHSLPSTPNNLDRICTFRQKTTARSMRYIPTTHSGPSRFPPCHHSSFGLKTSSLESSDGSVMDALELTLHFWLLMIPDHTV